MTAQKSDFITVGAMHKCRADDRFSVCTLCGATAEKLGKPCKAWMAEADEYRAALAVPQAPLQAEPVPVVASEVVAWMRAGANPWHGWEACAEGDPNGFPVYRATPQAEPAVAEQAREELETRLRSMSRTLANIASDPMWSNHAEISKRTLNRASEVMTLALSALASQSTPPPESACQWCQGTGNDERDEGFDSKKYPCQECGGSGWDKPPVIGMRRSEWKALSPEAQEKLLQITGAGSRAVRLAAAQAAHNMNEKPLLTNPQPESAGQGLSDAERYRWLRSNDAWEHWNRLSHYGYVELDKQIDLAILAANPTAQPDGGSKA